jgi:hypothetical protein
MLGANSSHTTVIGSLYSNSLLTRKLIIKDIEGAKARLTTNDTS